SPDRSVPSPPGNGPTVSVDRIRWRYVGTPDASSGSGTTSASPLLANVRCRDGILRPILYYVTTNATGTVGHIYALDPIGNRRTLTVNPLPAPAPKYLVTNYDTTTAYWVYPSYRPLTTTETAAGQVPSQYHDPNYNASAQYMTGVPAYDGLEARRANGSFTGN